MSLTAPKGTFDTLPPDSERFLAVRDRLTAPLRRAGYGYVETPVFEHTEVFSRGVGESTVRALAEAGPDIISIGALTHSVRCLDLGLDAG